MFRITLNILGLIICSHLLKYIKSSTLLSKILEQILFGLYYKVCQMPRMILSKDLEIFTSLINEHT